VLIGSEVLIAEEDDPVVDEGVVDPLEVSFVQGRGQIDAVDHGTHMRRELLYADRCWRHGSLLWLAAILWRSAALFNRALPARAPLRWGAARGGGPPAQHGDGGARAAERGARQGAPPPGPRPPPPLAGGGVAAPP